MTATDPRTENDVLYEAALAGAEPKDLGDGFHSTIVPAGAQHVLIDLGAKTRELAPHADRKKGARTVSDPESLLKYLRRHATTDTEIWASLDQRRIVAYLDGHSEKKAGWHDHKATLAVSLTPEWEAWNKVSGEGLTQTQFAEFIEQRAEDVVRPSAAELMEIAQTITGTRNAEFTSAHRVSDGRVQISYAEEVNAQAGSKGDLKIPEKLELGLRPFIGGVKFKLEASLRWRLIKGGGVSLGWTLIDPKRVLEAAFEEYLTEVQDGLSELAADAEFGVDIPLYRGVASSLI